MKITIDITLVTGPLTEKDNTALKKEIETHSDAVSRTAALLLRYRNGEGWKLDGYASFNEAAPKEWPKLFGSTSQLYRLLDKAEVEQNTGVSVPIHVAQEIAKLPPQEQAPALHEATEAAGGKPTVAAAKAAVEKRQAAAPEKQKPAAGTKLDAALDRLEELCGKKVADAIRNGELSNVKSKSAIYWAGLKDSQVQEMHELVVTKRWTPEKARKFLDKAPGEKSTITDLQLLAISQDGATLVVTGSFCTVVYNWKSKVHAHGQIKKLLGL